MKTEIETPRILHNQAYERTVLEINPFSALGTLARIAVIKTGEFAQRLKQLGQEEIGAVVIVGAETDGVIDADINFHSGGRFTVRLATTSGEQPLEPEQEAA